MLRRLRNLIIRAYYAILRWLLRPNPPLDFHWVTARIAVGGEIRGQKNMAKLAEVGFTHIVNLQQSVDDARQAGKYGLEVHHDPFDDDEEPKPSDHFERVVAFAQAALQDPKAKLYVHCTAGVHRGPLMTLELLQSLGYAREDALARIQAVRPIAEFPETYLHSLDKYLAAPSRGNQRSDSQSTNRERDGSKSNPGSGHSAI